MRRPVWLSRSGLLIAALAAAAGTAGAEPDAVDVCLDPMRGPEERLAAFLLNLSQRFAARGYSPTEFILRMTRRDIGSYLGLKLETVSRTFSALQRRRLIRIRQRHVRILDLAGLKSVVVPKR